MKTCALLPIAVVTLTGFSASALVPDSPPRQRRAFLSDAVSSIVAASAAATASALLVLPASASPEILTTSKGVKYAITAPPPKGDKAAVPRQGDIVAIEYTGYLTSGQIFDATHSEGKRNALLFKLGNEGAVIPGLNDIVANMAVGEKVQAIVPPSLAFGDVGVCIESGECLIKPGSTLVYDVKLIKSSIPPP